MGAAEGARQGRRQTLFRARYRDPCRRRRHRPARAVAADRRRAKASRFASSRRSAPLSAIYAASRASVSAGRWPLRSDGEGCDRLRRRLPGQSGNARALSRRQHRHDEGARQQARHWRSVAPSCSISARGPSGHWQSGHMSPIDANAPDFETPQHEDGRGNTQSRYDYPYGISVNALGVRFFDEGEAQHSYTYAEDRPRGAGAAGRARLSDLRSEGHQCLRYPHHKATFEEAKQIAELAEKIGLEPEVLTHTIEEFNRAAPMTRRSHRRRPTAKPLRTWIFPNRTGPTGSTSSRRSAPTGHRRHHVHVRRRRDERRRRCSTHGSADQRAVRLRRHRWLFFHNYPSFHRADRNAVFGKLAGKVACRGKNLS